METKDIIVSSMNEYSVGRSGKTIAKLTSPYQSKLNILNELAGSVPATVTLEEAREERLSKI